MYAPTANGGFESEIWNDDAKQINPFLKKRREATLCKVLVPLIKKFLLKNSPKKGFYITTVATWKDAPSPPWKIKIKREQSGVRRATVTPRIPSGRSSMLVVAGSSGATCGGEVGLFFGQ